MCPVSECGEFLNEARILRMHARRRIGSSPVASDWTAPNAQDNESAINAARRGGVRARAAVALRELVQPLYGAKNTRSQTLPPPQMLTRGFFPKLLAARSARMRRA